jgi:hypothetical protein
VAHSLKMRLLLIIILTPLSFQLFSQTDKAKSFRDTDGVVITIADTTMCTSRLTYEFFEKNFYGKLIMPELDVKTLNYEFTVTSIGTTTDKEFVLTIYTKADPKVRAIAGHGKSVYKLIIKNVDGQVKIDKLIYLYSEI